MKATGRRQQNRFRIVGLIAGTLIVLVGLAGCLRNDRGQGQAPPGATPLDPPVSTPSSEPSFPSAGTAFDGPLRIQQAPGGWLLVSDPKRKSIHRVSPESLQSDRTLRIAGTPLGVGMIDGQVLVGLKEAHAVAVYSNAGDPAGYLAEPGTVDYPGDLAIDGASGRVFVLDGIARSVKVFDLADRSLTMVLGAGQLLAPTAVALDPSRQEVLVSDYGSAEERASVKVFSYATDPPGDLVATLTAGTCNSMGCNGGFSRPRGLAVFDGRIFLADSLLGQVLVFDRSTLQRVGTLGSTEPATRELRLPSDIAITAAGDVFVTSTLGRVVVRFQGGAL